MSTSLLVRSDQTSQLFASMDMLNVTTVDFGQREVHIGWGWSTEIMFSVGTILSHLSLLMAI
jgi:hypothetical protein